MSTLYTALAGIGLALYIAPPIIRRWRIRRKHNVFHYIEYNLYGDHYTTRENGALSEFIAEGVLWQIEVNGGAVTYHYKRQSLDAVQAEIDTRYDKEIKQQRESKTW